MILMTIAWYILTIATNENISENQNNVLTFYRVTPIQTSYGIYLNAYFILFNFLFSFICSINQALNG